MRDIKLNNKKQTASKSIENFQSYLKTYLTLCVCHFSVSVYLKSHIDYTVYLCLQFPRKVTKIFQWNFNRGFVSPCPKWQFTKIPLLFKLFIKIMQITYFSIKNIKSRGNAWNSFKPLFQNLYRTCVILCGTSHWTVKSKPRQNPWKLSKLFQDISSPLCLSLLSISLSQQP